MACNSCKDVILLDPDASGLDYTTTVTSVEGVDGRSYNIQSPLVPAPHQPKGGWKLHFTINGQRVDIPARSAKDAINKATAAFALNNIPVSRLNLWFNANLQWLERAVSRYQRVNVEHLLAVADAHSPAPQGNHELLRRSVSEWGDTALASISLYLDGAVYAYDKFLTMAEDVRTLMNPTENPLMGSTNYFIKMSLRVAALRDVPLYTQEEAKVWLQETKTYLGFV